VAVKCPLSIIFLSPHIFLTKWTRVMIDSGLSVVLGPLFVTFLQEKCILLNSVTFHKESVFFHFILFLIKYNFLVESDGQKTVKGPLSIITRKLYKRFPYLIVKANKKAICKNYSNQQIHNG
jgi:hypothetical protein